jgi:hypothetical protein
MRSGDRGLERDSKAQREIFLMARPQLRAFSGHVLNPVLINDLLRARQEKELRNLQEGVMVDFQNSSVSKYMTVSQGKYCRLSLIRYKLSRPFVL